jgi:hypothetical protein
MKVDIVSKISATYKSICPFLVERSRRIWATSKAKTIGRGGINTMRAAIGMGYFTIGKGFEKLEHPPASSACIRRAGGGRENKIETDQTLLDALKSILDLVTRCNPMNPLLGTNMSLSKIVTLLKEKNHGADITTIRLLLKQLGYTLQSNRKRREGEDHPDRNAQFEYINEHIQKQNRE